MPPPPREVRPPRPSGSFRSAVLALACIAGASAADGTWTAPSGGNWSDPANWAGAIVADGTGFAANFGTLDPAADATIVLDAPRTISQLVFGDTDPASPASWILDDGGVPANLLTLAGTAPGIIVNALGSGKSAVVSTAIAGNSGLAKSGNGLLVLDAANTFSGTTAVAGPLELRHFSALASSTALAFSNSSTLRLRSDLAGTFSTPAATLPTGGTVTLDSGPLDSGATQTLTLGGALQLTHNASTTGTVNVTGSAGFSLAIPTVNISNNAASGSSQVRLAFKPTTANLVLGAVNGLTTGGGRDPYLILDGTSTGNRVTGRIANPPSGAAWTFVTKQGTGTWTLTGPSNNFAGTCAINAGILNVQVNSALGNTNRGTSVANGATLQLQSAASLNYSTAEALTLNGSGVANQGALQNVAGTNTFAGLLTLAGNTRIQSDAGLLTLSHAGTITGPGFDLTIGGAGDLRLNGILGTTTGDLVKTGGGTLTLAGANTFTGITDLQAGTLALTATGSISNSTRLELAAGAVFDISAIPAYAWPATTPLHAAGGDLKGGTTLDLGTTPLVLDFTPASLTGDLSSPALTLSSGTLAHAGPLTVVNLAPAPLGIGSYRLISQASGPFTAAPAFDGIVGGQGIAPGTFCYLQPNGGHLDLVVSGPLPTATAFTRDSGIAATTTYGDTLRFLVQVTPPPNGGSVEILDGANVIATVPLAAGSALVTLPDTVLAAGPHPLLVARFPGTAWHLPSTSAALSQTVSLKPLTLTGAVALDKYYDASTAATLTGTLTGVEAGDTVSFTPTGTFASPAVGNDIPVTSTAVLTGASAANYTLVPPTGLVADIVAANVWTGGAGGTGTNLATGANYSPAAATTNPYNAIFNGTDPAATDLTLASVIGGAVGTSGMVFGFTRDQLQPVTITGSTGATARIASIMVAPGAGAVTFQGTLPFTLGGPSTNTSHSFVNDSANPLVFQNTGNWVPGGSGTIQRAMIFGGAGNITVASSIVPSTPSRMSLTKSGAGTLALSGANTFSGGTTIQQGKVIAATSNALGAGAVVHHGTLDLTAGAVAYTGLSSSLSGTGTVHVTLGTGSASTLLNGNYSAFTGTWNLGTGAAPGAGKVQMNGADHPSATIRVLENATLYTTAGTHNASLVLHGGNTGESLGQLRIEGGATWAGDITLAGPVTGTGDGHVGSNSGTGTIGGPIGETGGPQALVKDGDGTIVLTSTNTYTGATLVNDGTLRVDSPGSLAAASAVTVASGATLAGNGAIHGPVTVASGGTITGSLALDGPVTVQAGGRLDATDPTVPSINVAGTLTLEGFLDLGIDRTRTPQAGNLTITGNLIRGGTLRILNTGPELRLGDTFTVTIAAGTASGTFASTLFPALDYGLAWNTSQFAANGTITVVANTGFTASTTTLTPATTNQQIHGIGANFALGPQSIAWSNTNFNTAFSPSGLNISFARLANSFECALDEPEIFWSGWDSDNVRFIEKFRALQPDGLLTLSAWSPPGSLKSTGSANGGTLAKSGNAYRYADYAAWWLRSLQYLRDNSTLPVQQAIPDFISIQNECDFTPSGDPFYAAWQAGCYLNSTETSTKAGYPQALAAVKSAFQANGFGFVKFIGPDTTTASPSVISSYLNNLPADSFAAIAHHPYQGSVNNVGNNTSSLSGLRAAYPSATIYMTEFFGDDPYGPDVPAWMMHALPLHNVLTVERANSYLMWGLSLSPASGSFCALGHYSKFIHPGDWRSAASTNDPNVVVSLFRRTGDPGIPQQLVLVMINKSATYSYQTVHTSSHWAADPDRRLWQVYQTADDGSTTRRLTLTEDLGGSGLNGNRNLVLAPYSITTALINSDAPISNQENWRQVHFGTHSNLGNAADNADPDGDGESNLYEFATGQNPVAGTRVSPVLSLNGANLEFTYTRSKAAVLDGLAFTVEWSDTLGPGTWSSLDVTESTLSQTDTLETRRALIPRGATGARFVRLRIGL